MSTFEACSRIRKRLVTVWNFSYLSLLSVFHRRNENQNVWKNSNYNWTLSYVATCLKILAFSSSLVTLKFSFHNSFKTRVLLKIFDTKFSYKLSYLKHLCLLAKMTTETVTIKFPNSLKSKLIISWAWGLLCLMNVFSIFVSVTLSRSRNVFCMIYKWSTDLQVINFFSIHSGKQQSTSQQVRSRCKAESLGVVVLQFYRASH